MGASVPKSAAQVHDDAVANQHKVGDVLPPFHYKLPKYGKTGMYFLLELQHSTLTPKCNVGNLAKNLKSALQTCNQECTKFVPAATETDGASPRSSLVS